MPASGQLQPQTGLHGDYGALALLLLLYTLQGIPIGLSAVVPMVLAEKQVSSLDQAVFSIVQYPFAMKLLWAPLVDSVYSRWVGRRKSWILPVQPAIGALMLYSSGKVEAILGSAAPNVKVLTGYFLAFYMLAATQDIAVDGLALTALSERTTAAWQACRPRPAPAAGGGEPVQPAVGCRLRDLPAPRRPSARAAPWEPHRWQPRA